MKTKRVVLVVYKIEKGRGSEDGSGYNFASHLVQNPRFEVTLISRQNNIDLLRRDSAFVRAKLIGYDVPEPWARIKRRSRGIVLYYYLWQIGVGKIVRRLVDREVVDVVHQYNFHTDWAPHFFPAAGGFTKVIWGPICHQPRLPLHYHVVGRKLLLRSWFVDSLKPLMKQAFWACDPHLRRAIQRSSVILYANRDVAPPFRGAQVAYQTFGGSDLETVPKRTPSTENGTLFIHVGRLEPIKGPHIALEALAEALRREPEASLQLRIIGDGSLRRHLERRARALGVTGFVELVPWLSRDELAQQFNAADAFLYPSLGNQDSVVGEALAAGLPIIGISGTGTEAMASTAVQLVPRSPRSECVRSLADCMLRLHGERSGSAGNWVEYAEAAMKERLRISWPATVASVSAWY